MRKNEVLELLLKRKVKDYSFTIVFFFIFAFFVFFAIRPNLVTVFTLQEELAELQKLDNNYENVVLNLVEMQALLETHRDNLSLLDYAMPVRPQVNKVIEDINKTAQDSGISLQKLDVGDVELKENISQKNSVKSFIVHAETISSYDSVIEFLNLLTSQRRLKTIHNLSIIKENNFSTESAVLKIKMEIEGYYL